MKYEWDEDKHQKNLGKHGLDFIIGYKIYESSEKITIPAKYEKEKRWIDIAPVGEDLFVLTMIYTYRKERIRIIALRKAKRKERRLYYETKKNCQI